MNNLTAQSQNLLKKISSMNFEDATKELVAFVEQYKKQETKQPLVFPFSSQVFIEAWNVLVTEPKWRKKTNKAYQMALHKLSKYSEEVAIQAIEDAITGNYQGIFPENVKIKGVTFETEAQKRLRQANNLSEALQNGQVTWKS